MTAVIAEDHILWPNMVEHTHSIRLLSQVGVCGTKEHAARVIFEYYLVETAQEKDRPVKGNIINHRDHTKNNKVTPANAAIVPKIAGQPKRSLNTK